jgi:hypothetical protein
LEVEVKDELGRAARRHCQACVVWARGVYEQKTAAARAD